MKSALSLLLAFSFLTSCSSDQIRPEGAAVIIKDTHFHTRFCGHYKFHDQWYFIEQHRHGVDCGHEKVNGEWILPDDDWSAEN